MPIHIYLQVYRSFYVWRMYFSQKRPKICSHHSCFFMDPYTLRARTIRGALKNVHSTTSGGADVQPWDAFGSLRRFFECEERVVEVRLNKTLVLGAETLRVTLHEDLGRLARAHLAVLHRLPIPENKFNIFNKSRCWLAYVEKPCRLRWNHWTFSQNCTRISYPEINLLWIHWVQGGE